MEDDDFHRRAVFRQAWQLVSHDIRLDLDLLGIGIDITHPALRYILHTPFSFLFLHLFFLKWISVTEDLDRLVSLSQDNDDKLAEKRTDLRESKKEKKEKKQTFEKKKYNKLQEKQFAVHKESS